MLSEETPNKGVYMNDEKPRLKVMHIVSGDLWAGAEVQVYTLLSQLRKHCDLTVILLNPGRLERELSGINIPTIIFDESKMNTLSIFLNIVKKMKEKRPQVVHTHRLKENIIGSIANITTIRAKCVRTVHGAPEFHPKGWRRISTILDRFSGFYLQDAIIAVSIDLKNDLKRIFPEKKIHIIQNGIDIDRLKRKVEKESFFRDMSSYIHIGIVGRVENVKRIDIFIDMAKILIEKNKNHKFFFHVVGEGSQRRCLEEKAKSYGLSGCMEFYGFRDDVHNIISSLDILIMCSDHEGMPMTALEAIAIGTTVVARNTGGLSEMLENYPLLLVNNHSPQGYASVVTELLNSSSIDVSLPNKFKANFNADKVMKVYKDIN